MSKPSRNVFEAVLGFGPFSPHVHGGVEFLGVDRARVELAIRQACCQSILKLASTHNALKIKDMYGHLDRWGRYVCRSCDVKHLGGGSVATRCPMS